MKAPSEKHLEDYLWAHPEALGMIGIPPQYGPDRPVYDFWLRQFNVPSGIIDMIGIDYRVNVFELKKGMLTAQSLTQLMRYMFDVKNMVDRLLNSYTSYGEPLRTWASQYWDNDASFNMTHLVHGALIGRGYENENLLIACAGCGVDVYTYDYTESGYEFEDCSVEWKLIMDIGYHNAIEKLANGDFGSKFFEFYKDSIYQAYDQDVQKHNDSFNVIRAAEDFIEDTEGGDV